MTEEFLQYIWKYALYEPSSLRTHSGEQVEILKPGEHNSNSGPDFLNSKLRIGNTVWAGDVEVHLNSSDWYKHNHQNDRAYNSVILQVVLKNDKETLHLDGSLIPTIEIKFDVRMHEHYQQLINSNKWIPCKDYIKKIDQFVFYCWLDALTIERLQEKSEVILQTLKTTKNDWTQTFYIHLAKNFGFKVNSDPFEMLARSLPLKYIAKHKDNQLQIEALLFGQAGFLKDNYKDDYFLRLSREYHLLQSKFSLKPLEKHIWKFMRLRPDNFPTIRLSQFACLLHQSSFLFNRILETKSISQLQKYFNISASEYWDSHHNFSAKSNNQRKKIFGVLSFNNLIINTIAPFVFVYGNENGNEDLKDRALNFLAKTPVEENVIVRNWGNLGFYPKNAFETQGMIQLKNKYCDKRQCLKCQIGNKIISGFTGDNTCQ